MCVHVCMCACMCAGVCMSMRRFMHVSKIYLPNKNDKRKCVSKDVDFILCLNVF